MNIENTGEKFNLELFQKARELTWLALEKFHVQVKPGMKESEGKALIEKILTEMGTTKRWHKSHVRFGKNTLKSFSDLSDGDPILQEDDIFFADIGPVFFDHEGDCGNTWVIGNDERKKACAKDAKILFDKVANHWRENKLTGKDLYKFGEQQAQEMGWVLSTHKGPGHRLCDFPHMIFHKGKLSDLEKSPIEGLWVLEIQIEHPEGHYGAFYEDLLI